MKIQNWRQWAGYGLLGCVLMVAVWIGFNKLGHKPPVTNAPTVPAPHLVKPKVPLPKPAPHKQLPPKPKQQAVQKQQLPHKPSTVPSQCFPVCPLNINPWANRAD